MVWASGTQVLLANPVCLLGFLRVLMRFFRDRIAYEERLLLRGDFFGDEYREYMARTRSLLPWDVPGV